MIKAYLRFRFSCLFVIFISLSCSSILLTLYGNSLSNILYLLFLTLFFCFLCACFDFVRFVNRVKTLQLAHRYTSFQLQDLPEPKGQIECCYHDIIEKLTQEIQEAKERYFMVQKEREELVTLWVHQIKLPLASLQLMSESWITCLPEDQQRSMKSELFRVEQYAQMALQTIQIENLQEDLVITECDLGQCIRKTLHKYASMFILQKLQLHYESFSYVCHSDVKWLCFILEQLLSNSLKYTQQGSITMMWIQQEKEGILRITDTGCGINPVDLPRVFERGYTGYNGRSQYKSSGIGLYLCRKVADQLHIGIQLFSEVNQGTSVELSFTNHDCFFLQ